MRSVAATCLLLLLACGTAFATTRSDFEGSWVGMRQDAEVVWQVGEDGRLRIDGRPGDYVIEGDTLIVRFDPPSHAEPTALGETAVYRFVASIPASGTARLYVYGFDLGKQGLHLERAVPQHLAASEDAASPVPDPAPGRPLVSAVPSGAPTPNH